MNSVGDIFDLSGKTALVTGASRGLGAHFAEVLARANARVILGGRHLEQLRTVVSRLPELQRNAATVLPMDLLSSESISDALGSLKELDILVNNAGVVHSAAALEQSEADWDSVVDTNLKGPFLVSQMAAKLMAASGRGGSIINIASILGLRQSAAVLPYAVSKAGLIQLTKVLALELARFNVRVNALAPGYFDTELNRDFWQSSAGEALVRRIPQRRLGQRSELDGPLLLLASEASRYMTGAVIAVDGGHLVSGL
jgi:NAD(P)-dependent dehydrogenase (short-subunit alcohol dehydrogenase family)